MFFHLRFHSCGKVNLLLPQHSNGMKVKLELIRTKQQSHISIQFPYNKELIQLVKNIPAARWDSVHRIWKIPGREETLHSIAKMIEKNYEVEIADPPVYQETAATISDASAKAGVQQFETWLTSKRYSESTVKTYLNAIQVFLSAHPGKLPEEITADDFLRFNKEYILKRNLSPSYQNQVVNALKLFYRVVENRCIRMEDIHRPRREHRLPNVLSKEEVKAILGAHGNVKHKAMLSLIYSCGLRRSELIGLKPEHIDSKRMLVMIRQGKGKKDRIVPLSPRILELLRDYYKAYKPSIWLFEGEKAGSSYDERSLSQVLKSALRKAGIRKPVSLHWLRHSYATHLLESGTDLRYIQELLGHNSSRTTEIYTHVSTRSIQKISSPFDNL